jgi:hypothetical protein
MISSMEKVTCPHCDKHFKIVIGQLSAGWLASSPPRTSRQVSPWPENQLALPRNLRHRLVRNIEVRRHALHVVVIIERLH